MGQLFTGMGGDETAVVRIHSGNGEHDDAAFVVLDDTDGNPSAWSRRLRLATDD